jgi:hypothetical protein
MDGVRTRDLDRSAVQISSSTKGVRLRAESKVSQHHGTRYRHYSLQTLSTGSEVRPGTRDRRWAAARASARGLGFEAAKSRNSNK